MRVRLATIAVLVLVAPAFSTAANSARAARPKPGSQGRDGHVARATPIVRRWRNLAVGVPTQALDDAAHDPQWLQHALIQQIRSQTGLWRVRLEDGYTVFRIYPYLAKNAPQPSRYLGIVLKVNGDRSPDDLVHAIRRRDTAFRIDEYDLFGVGKWSIYRRSRPAEPGQ